VKTDLEFDVYATVVRKRKVGRVKASSFDKAKEAAKQFGVEGQRLELIPKEKGAA
jgi:hypothetical protein